ncbi:hypothetical protein GCM10011583_14230 [Streptomyces camponoticapitis]|uniref:DUF2690 domain-containing protein n=1 Tax=Streptomyces camponoticapitis TaxID=1616125 RepID=A0ABQ2E051_9ACTN|nr:hypothetical protein [Streptomyces camponoticapitis]GGJ83740.1 hypothetical protein GCM10011583_14230 [Streptomyces camponoticapitis]
MRYTKRAVVAAACAFALIPAGAAFAGDGPAPQPSKSAKAKSTAPSEAGNPASAKARVAGVCADAYQVGKTAYIDRAGAHIASVKQFYSKSCNENYGYLWVWDSFRNVNKDYDVSVAVYSYTKDDYFGGQEWTDHNAQEFWSLGADTVKDCTSAVGSLRRAGDPLAGQAASQKMC